MKNSLLLFTAFLLSVMISSANADLMKYTFSGQITVINYQYYYYDGIVNGISNPELNKSTVSTTSAYGHIIDETFAYTFLVDTELPGYYIGSDGARVDQTDKTGSVAVDYFFVELESGTLIPDLTILLAAIPELAGQVAGIPDADISAYNYGYVYSCDPAIAAAAKISPTGVNFTEGKFTRRIEISSPAVSLAAWETADKITGTEYFRFNKYIDDNTSVDITSTITSHLTLVSVEPYIPVPEASMLTLLLSGLTALLPLSFIVRRKRSQPD